MYFLLGILLHLLLYAGADMSLRRGGLSRLLSRVGVVRPIPQALLLLALCWALARWVHWRDLWSCDTASCDAVRLLLTALGGVLTWNAATRDFDPTQRSPGVGLRLVLVLAAYTTYWTPLGALACAFVLSTGFSFWQHHASFPMRLLQTMAPSLSFLALVASLPFAQSLPPALAIAASASLITFLVIMQVSHYFITALAKVLLGPKWYSWILDNQLHHLVASAYSWGWGRFLRWETYRQLVMTVKRIEKPLQVAAFSLELLAPVALTSASMSMGFSLAFAAFHLGVFVLSGLLFWDWILVDLGMVALLAALPSSVLEAAFGIWPLLVSLAVLIAFPLRHQVWKPMPLGWFDTPLCAKVHWDAIGQSGKVYGVYNNFMCPHERLYGRVNGCFFVPHPVLSYHLGEVWRPEVRQEIVDSGADPRRLLRLRQRVGVWPIDTQLQARHLNYLKAFFCALNHGATKCVLPGWLWFLKAPGDQIYYWGHLPPYRRQEPVREVRLRFVEEYFDGANHVRLTERVVARIDIPDHPPGPVEPEPTPQQLDHFLLRHADGRLVDLRGHGRKRYTKALSEA